MVLDVWLKKIFILCVGLLLSLLWGCEGGDPKPVERESEQGQIRLVQVRPVKATPVRTNIEAVGTLIAVRKVNVSSEMGGMIERLYFEKGDRVKKRIIIF